MTSNAQRITASLALALLAVAALVATLPAASAGSEADPEIVDQHDEVAIGGPAGEVCSGGPGGIPPCPGFDFLWADADMDVAFINETTTELFLTLQNKAGTSFGAGVGFGGLGGGDTCAYVFNLNVGTSTYTATANVDSSGAVQPGGIASAATVHDGNQLTWTVAKATIGATPGKVLTGLFVTAHCETDTGIILDDRAPDANAGRDYTVTGGTTTGPLGGVVYSLITDAKAHVATGTTSPTTLTTQYNWTAGPASGRLELSLTVDAGTVAVDVLDAAGNAIYAETLTASKDDALNFTAKSAGNWTLTVATEGFTGTLTLDITPAATTIPPAPAPTPPSGPTTSPSGSVPPSSSPTSTTESKSSPIPLALVPLGLLAVLLFWRRQL